MSSNDNTSLLDPVRFSRLKRMGRSAAHYAHGVDDDTASLREGSATHAYLLGQAHRVAVYEGGARNKKYKKYRAFLDEHPDQLILSPAEFGSVEGMRRSIERHPRAMALLDGIQEQTIAWTLSGRACSGTPDVVQLRPDGSKVLVELKTGQSSAPDLFRWQARKLAYHAQLAWYARGLETALVYKPGPVVEQYIVAVESSPPYPVTVFRVTDALRLAGDKQCRIWFEHLLVCERTGNWPGYVECDVELDEDEVELEWDDEAAA
jgi:hypothetical protein